MADTGPTPPTDTPVFETDTVQADRAREQGLGLGERELKAQRDPGGIRTPGDAAPGALDESVGVQGSEEDGDESAAGDPAI